MINVTNYEECGSISTMERGKTYTYKSIFRLLKYYIYTANSLAISLDERHQPSGHMLLLSEISDIGKTVRSFQLILNSGCAHDRWVESTILFMEALQDYRMRQCWCCQIAGIWIEFQPGGAVSSADGACQTSNTTLIRTRGAVLAHMCSLFMHAFQKASFNNLFLASFTVKASDDFFGSVSFWETATA